MADELALYTIHVDREVREQASKVLTALLRTRPALREPLLLGVARLIGRVADEHEAVLLSLCQLLELLMRDWHRLLQEQAELGGGVGEPTSPQGGRLDATRLEVWWPALTCWVVDRVAAVCNVRCILHLCVL